MDVKVSFYEKCLVSAERHGGHTEGIPVAPGGKEREYIFFPQKENIFSVKQSGRKIPFYVI